MGNSFRQSMTWLHTWAGLVFCWVLYFIFVTGTVAYFDTEIDQWMQPEISAKPSQNTLAEIDTADNWLRQYAADANLWSISLPTSRNQPYLLARAVFRDADGKLKEIKQQRFDPSNGKQVSSRDTGGGHDLYEMHYRLHYLPGNSGFRIVGILTLLMFIGLISGIVIHKNIFKDFFTFRPNKGQRSWLDLHNLFAVSSLPFQLMITYSGLIFVIQLWMPLIGFASYGFDVDRITKELNELAGRIQIEATGESAPLLPLSGLAKQTEPYFDGLNNIRLILVNHPGDKQATVRIDTNYQGVNRFRENAVFHGASGELLQYQENINNIPLTVYSTFLGLHEGLFADISLRWLYFLAGLLGTAMVATGAIYWSVKREKTLAKEKRHFGHHLVSHLNIGTIIGLPIAIAAYFWANRLLPIEMANRAEWEIHCLFIVWLIALIHPLLRCQRRAWLEQLWGAAAVFILIPVINALTTERHVLQSVTEGDWVFAGFDLVCLGFGIAFSIAAIQLKKRWAPAKTRHTLSKASTAIIDSPQTKEH